LGERLGDLDRLRIETRAFLEVIGRRFEILAAQREPAELEPDLRAPRLVAALAEHLELRHVQLADHRIVAERRVQRARRLERVGTLRLELPRLLVVPERAIDTAEELVPELRGTPVMRRAPRDDLGLALVA